MYVTFWFILTILRRNHNNQSTGHGQSIHTADIAVACQGGAAFGEYMCVEFWEGSANNPYDTIQEMSNAVHNKWPSF